MEGSQLPVEQVLLYTLVVKIAVMAVLATMLARYRRFRHILIFERRAWPDRLTFALSLAIPPAAGVLPRLLLNYHARGERDAETGRKGQPVGPRAPLENEEVPEAPV